MVLMRRGFILGSASLAALGIVGCSSLPRFVADAVLPPPPPYPFQDPVAVNAEARLISERLARFIEDWLDGTGPAERQPT
jgi:hypothetical protein